MSFLVEVWPSICKDCGNSGTKPISKKFSLQIDCPTYSRNTACSVKVCFEIRIRLKLLEWKRCSNLKVVINQENWRNYMVLHFFVLEDLASLLVILHIVYQTNFYELVVRYNHNADLYNAVNNEEAFEFSRQKSIHKQ